MEQRPVIDDRPNPFLKAINSGRYWFALVFASLVIPEIVDMDMAARDKWADGSFVVFGVAFGLTALAAYIRDRRTPTSNETRIPPSTRLR